MIEAIHTGCLTEHDYYDLAAQEVAAARDRHPEQDQPLQDALRLLRPTHPGMCSAPLFRAHCREMLERVATGSDTQLGTGVEIMLAIWRSHIQPVDVTAAGLFLRLWHAAELPEIDVPAPAATRQDYEARHASAIDELDSAARADLTQPGRTLHPEP
ncbi:hypothetical protein AB0L82_36020 [Nocardia sp. NPDC052001]|uniref:hypothetical protein n=1 Tax=Nocardia sp. NPDC052001 TaxID=3154853 RepID=UPI0034382079